MKNVYYMKKAMDVWSGEEARKIKFKDLSNGKVIKKKTYFLGLFL